MVFIKWILCYVYYSRIIYFFFVANRYLTLSMA